VPLVGFKERELALVMVARDPAVKVDALVTRILFPALRVNGFAPPELMVPAPTKPMLVALKAIVSIESTPVSAPAVSTLRPVDAISNVPVALPTLVFDPATEERVVSPHDVKSVKIAVPGTDVPIDVKFAAPVALIFQLASVKERLADVFPRVKFPV